MQHMSFGRKAVRCSVQLSISFTTSGVALIQCRIKKALIRLDHNTWIRSRRGTSVPGKGLFEGRCCTFVFTLGVSRIYGINSSSLDIYTNVFEYFRSCVSCRILRVTQNSSLEYVVHEPRKGFLYPRGITPETKPDFLDESLSGCSRSEERASENSSTMPRARKGSAYPILL